MNNIEEEANRLIELYKKHSHTDFDHVRGGFQHESQKENAINCAIIDVTNTIEVMNKIYKEIDPHSELLVYDRLGFHKQVKEHLESKL